MSESTHPNPACESQQTPLEIVPADESRGTCPTLLVDGQPWHDPNQPYEEILPLEGRRPEVVALLGVGLGYTAAGALHLSPGCRVIAWEPLPGMAKRAQEILEQEWGLDQQVSIEGDLADFQARLIEACASADSLATVEIAGLAASHPDLQERFRTIVQEVVDAGTLAFAPRAVGDDKWERIAGGLPAVAATPPLARLSGAWADRHIFAIASLPGDSQLREIASCQSRTGIVTTPEVAHELVQKGLVPEVVVIGKSSPPPAEIFPSLSRSLLAITPDSHPAWWGVPSAGRTILGHTGCSFLLPEGDPGAVLSFRWGSEIPLAVAAVALGAARVKTVGFPATGDADWNWLAASRRCERVLSRIAESSGAKIEPWTGEDTAGWPSHAPLDLKRYLASAAPLGAGQLQLALSRSREAVLNLARERQAYRGRAREETLERYLLRRAEGHPFTRSFLVENLQPAENLGARAGEALAFLDKAASAVPGGSANPPVVAQPPDLSGETVRVYLGRTPGEEFPCRVLTEQIKRLSDGPIEVLDLPDALAAVLGPQARKLPQALRILLIPVLCGYQGRAIYVEPSVVVFEDLARLWSTPLGEFAALAPAEGPPSIMLIDNHKARWDPQELLDSLDEGLEPLALRLRPGVQTGIGALPPRWSARDELHVDTSAMRYTCEPWLPWLNDLHPLRWAWEFQLVTSLEEGRLSRDEFQVAVDKGLVRKGFVLPIAEPQPTGLPQLAPAASP